MSAASMDEAWAPVVAAQYNAVQQETWGHLAPRKNVAYRGRIVFAIGCFESGDLNPTVLTFNLTALNGEELSASPWSYDAITEFVSEIHDEREDEGHIYEWIGTFRNYKFKGQRRLIFDATNAG